MSARIRKPTASRLAGIAILAVALGGSACQSDTAGPEVGADIEDIQQQVDELENRVGLLEDQVGVEEDGGIEAPEEDTAVFGDAASFVGQQVTVSAKVTEDLGTSGFRLTGDDVGGEPLLVLNAGGATDVEEGQVVQVTGTVRVIETGVFEDAGFQTDDEFFSDFGVENEEEFITEFGGQHAIFAQSVEVLESGDEGIGQGGTDG